MKKLFAGFSALVLTAAAAMPLTAAAKNDDRNTAVEFSVAPSYIIVIPEKITLEENTETKIYENDLSISAEKIYLEEGKQVAVSLTSASGFKMKTADTEAEYLLPYTASTENFGKITDKQKGGKVAELHNGLSTLTVPVHFETDEIPQYAGDFSDTVVFTIAVENIPKTQEPTPDNG